MSGAVRYDRRRYLAAKSEVILATVCDAIRERYALPPFQHDSEVEGEDSWEYAHSEGESIGFNVTGIGEFVNPSAWEWMWGAPDRANYQLVLSWDSSRVSPERVVAIEAELSELLGCPIVPYPDRESA